MKFFRREPRIRLKLWIQLLFFFPKSGHFCSKLRIVSVSGNAVTITCLSTQEINWHLKKEKKQTQNCQVTPREIPPLSIFPQAVTAKLGEPTPGRVEARSQRSKRNSRRQNRNRDRNRRQNRNRNRGRDLRGEYYFAFFPQRLHFAWSFSILYYPPKKLCNKGLACLAYLTVAIFWEINNRVQNRAVLFSSSLTRIMWPS